MITYIDIMPYLLFARWVVVHVFVVFENSIFKIYKILSHTQFTHIISNNLVPDQARRFDESIFLVKTV